LVYTNTMNKKIWLIVFVGLVVVLAIGGKYLFITDKKSSPIFDSLNATYSVNGQSVSLINGKAQTPAAPGSASNITTMVFGDPVSGDLNGDGTTDAVIMLTQDDGGSGTFYYVAVAINTPSQGAVGTNAVLLGDRIAPQTIEIQNGQIVVNYADRAPGDPMTTQPSMGKTLYLTLTGTTLSTSTPMAGVGEHCGGNMMNAPICAAGYQCAPTAGSHLPFGDVGGTCMAK
jgi:hypothetical protein